MRSNRTLTFAIVAAALLIYGAAPSDAIADTACDAAPTPECVLDLAHASTELIDGPAAKASVLTRIAVAEAAAGYKEQSESSLALAQLIADGTGLADGLGESDYGPRTEEDVRAMLYRQIVAARAQSGASLSVLTRMIDEAEDTENKLMLSYVAAEALIEAGRTDDARPMIDRILSETENDDNAERAAFIYTSTAMMYARIADFGAAMDLARQLPDSDEQLEKLGLLIQIAEAQREAGDDAGAETTLAVAEQTIPGIENTEMREMATNMLSRMRPAEESSQQSSAPDSGSCPADLSPYGLAVDKAKFGYFEEALEIALTLEDPEKRDRALSRIASLQSKQGYMDNAYNTALMIGESFNRAYAMREIVQAYAKAGNADGARMAAQAIPEEPERNATLAMTMDPLVAAGNPAGAAQIVRDMPDPRQRAVAYAGLVENLLNAAEAEAKQDAGAEADGEEQEPG